MAENLDETQEPQEPQQPTLNEKYLEIIDAGDITTVYSSKAKPVLNIKWDLENPLTSEVGLTSEAGIGNVSNSLVAGGFRRSEIDNIIGRNTSVFVSNVTNELYGNGSNAANQISSQTPRPLLVRKRLIRIIDIWNRIIFGMNINARDNASMNRFFGANLQTNADVLFRNQISHTDANKNVFNETNSWTWLVNPDPSFIFSQISRFLYACIFEIKEKIKLLNTIVDGAEDAESNSGIESLGINTDTFNIPSIIDTAIYTSLLEPVHIIPDITHKVWNWSVPPTNTSSKFQLLGAFSKHIPQKYSIMLFEPNFLVLLQELIDIIMDMPEEEHFSEIFKDIYVNPKDVRLIEVLVKELVPVEGATSESKIDFDSVHFTGIESIQNEPTKTSHIQFNDIYNFYLKCKNDFDFINETNAYNIKKKKYRYYEDIRVWEENNSELPEEEREPQPLPEVANWANTRDELPELRKYDFVDEPFMDEHLPYKDNPQYKFPINKNTEQIKALNTRFANWVKLQKESYANLDKLLTVFEYCSDLTSDVRYRSRWDHGKTKRARATHYDMGNRIDNIAALNISKLSTRLGIEYFKSLDTYNKKAENKEINSTSPKPKPFFKNKVFSTEIYSGLNGSTGTVERNWKFGWSIVKFPKKFEIAPKTDEIPATIVNGEKYIPCSWFSSGSNEILFPRQFIDTTDEDDEMYIGFYNACTSFGVSAQMEEQFRQQYPLLTGTENMHGTSLVTVNTLKPQIHANFFKLAFIGDSTGKYFPDSQEKLEASPYGLDREAITKADIFVNIKADDDYPNKDEKFLESMDNESDKPFVDSFKNIKIFYRLN